MARFEVELRPLEDEGRRGIEVRALTPEGRVASRIAALCRPAFLDGSPVDFLQVVEFWNDFEAGRGLSRAFGLEACGRALAERGGPGPEGVPLVYGVPNRRAHRFGLRRLRWEVLRAEAELVLAPRGLKLGPAPGVDVSEFQAPPAGLEALMERQRTRRGALLRRDRERFAHLPAGIRWAEARRRGELLGVAGLRGGRLVDWLVDDEPAAMALLAWCDECARTDPSGDPLSTSLPDSQPEWLLFQRAGFQVHAGHAYTVFRSFQKPYVMSWLFQNWYYTPLDLETPV